MSRRARRRHGLHGPNMTPMVDVVLVILIFFMAAMGIAVREQYLRTGTPPAKDAKAGATSAEQAPADPSALPPAKAVLRMARESGRTVVSGLGMERAPLGEITRRLADFRGAGASANVIVVVAPSGDVPYQDVVIVHDACAGAGIANVRLGVIGE